MLRHYEPVRLRRWAGPEADVLRISETVMDVARQVCAVKYTAYEFFPDGRVASFEETQTNRFFLVQEMSYFLTQNGFSPLQWFAGFHDEENITDQTWHIVAVARRYAP